MKFIGLASSEQARRGFWRVVLKGDAFDLGFLFDNPLTTWPTRVDQWRAAVDADKAKLAATTSPASVCGSESAVMLGARGVVDVRILGADAGETVGAIARRLNDLVTNVDIESIESIENADPVARDAACRLSRESDKCGPLGLTCAADAIALALKIAAVVAVVYVSARLIQAAKS